MPLEEFKRKRQERQRQEREWRQKHPVLAWLDDTRWDIWRFCNNALGWVWGQRYNWQRLTRGYGDDELWSLDSSISRFVLPRLKAFRADPFGHPGDLDSLEQWQAELDEMIFAFEFDVHAYGEYPTWEQDYERAQRGLALFAKRYWHLWQ